MIPQFLSYVLSFVYVGYILEKSSSFISGYRKKNGSILSLLFSLTIVPLSTAWMGENYFTYEKVMVITSI